MRFHELLESGQTLYHGSRKRFKIGTILRPQRGGYVAGSGMDKIERAAHTKLEGYLDTFRPTGAVSRANAVFMCARPQDIDYAGGYDDYVYVVDPIGPVHRCNLHWYSQLFSYSFEDGVYPPECAEWAQNYWSAKPSKNALYEYLAASAKVVGLDQ